MSTAAELRSLVEVMTEAVAPVCTCAGRHGASDREHELSCRLRAWLEARRQFVDHATVLVALVEACERAIDAARRRFDADAAAGRSMTDASGVVLDFASAVMGRVVADEDGRAAMRDMEVALAAVHAVRGNAK